MDRQLEKLLSSYVDVEVERVTSNYVNRHLNSYLSHVSYENLLVSQDSNISYDTVIMNQILRDVTNYVQDVLGDLDEGRITDDEFFSSKIRKSRFQGIQRGILCDVSIGSLKNSTLFANIGPTIPLRLIFLGQTDVDFDIQTDSYGINNVVVRIFLVVHVKEQVVMPLSSNEKEIVIRKPISVDIIQGEIPTYFNHF